MSNKFMSELYTGIDKVLHDRDFKEYKNAKSQLEKKFLPKGEGLSLASKKAIADYFNKILGSGKANDK